MGVFDDDEDEDGTGLDWSGAKTTPSAGASSDVNSPPAPPPVQGADSSVSGGPDSHTQQTYATAPAKPEAVAPLGPADDPTYSVAAPQLPKSVPLTPLPDHSQDATAWAAQKASENPAQYKPSGWRRVLAGIAGGMVAAGSRNPQAGVKIGESVLNAPKERVEAQWAQQEAPLIAKQQADGQQDQAIRDNNAAAMQTNNENDRQFRNQVYAQGANARANDANAQAQARRNAVVSFTPDNPANPYDGGTGVTADGRTVKGVQPPDSWMKTYVHTTAGQVAMQQATLQQRKTAAAQIGLKGQDLTDFLANGKIPARAPNTNIRIPSAASQEYEDAKAAMIRENGGRPLSSAQLLSLSRKSGTSGGGDPEDAVGAIVGKFTNAKEQEAAKYKQNKDGTYTNQINGLTYTPKQFSGIMDGFRVRMNADPTMRKLGYQMDEHGNVRPYGQQAPATAAPAAAPQTPPSVRVPSGKTVTVGMPVIVNGRKGTISGINPKTGKPVVAWAGGQ